MAKKVLVGILLLGALVVFALATFYIENWQFSVLSKGYKLTAHFEQARDLSAGDEVRINGVEVGRIHSISVDTETASPRPVAVELYLLSDVKVREEDVANIQMRSVFGCSFISISRGITSARLLTDGDEIPETQVGAGISEVVEKADTLLADASESLDGASETLDNLGEVTRKLAEGEGTLGKLLTDEEAYNDLQETLASVRDAFASVKEIAVELGEGEGLFSKLLKDEEMAATVTTFFDDAAQVAENLKLITADLREGKGAAGKLLNDEEMAAKLDQIVTDTCEGERDPRPDEDGRRLHIRRRWDNRQAAERRQALQTTDHRDG